MHDPYRNRLILFSNTFPYGTGETFLAEEIPHLAKEFTEIVIYPLYEELGTVREVPSNARLCRALLPFNHKDKLGFLTKGIFNTAPFFFAFKEFFSRTLCGRDIKLERGKKKAGLFKRLRIFFNYFLMLRTMLGERKQMERILSECAFADKIYFYWGDKSAMMIPFLKKRLAPMVETLPKFCVRFHGSDLYEGAKGYLPFRNEIFAETDFAIMVSNNGASYIKKNYNPAPKLIETWHLGSAHHSRECTNLSKESSPSNIFNIVSCSNVIELKRVNLILSALKLLVKDGDALDVLKDAGYDSLSWTHFGGGVLFESLKKEVNEFLLSLSQGSDFNVNIELKGVTPHKEVLEFYQNRGADLFILVSRSEGVPVSIMEAFSYGIPVIATNVGGVSELFRNCPLGYLVDSSITAQGLEAQIVEFIKLPAEIKKQMRENAFENWAENWDAKKNYSAFAQELAAL